MSLYDSLGETAFSINDPTISRAPPFKYTRTIAYNGNYWLAGGTVTVRSVTIKSFADVITYENIAYDEDGQIRLDSVRYSKEQAANYLPAHIANKKANLDLAKEIFAQHKSLNYLPQTYTRRSVHCFAKSTDGLNWKYVETCPFVFQPLTSSSSAGADNYTRVNSIAWNGTKWMAVGRGSGYVVNNSPPVMAEITVVESDDGETWTIVGRGYAAYNVRPELNMVKSPTNTNLGYTPISSNEMFCVTCDTTKWIVGGDNGLWKKGFTETSWTSIASNIERTRYLGIATDGTTWVAVGGSDLLEGFYQGSQTNAGAIISSTDGGVTWAKRASFDMYPDARQQTFKAVAWNGDKWVAVGNRGPTNQSPTTGVIAVSEDGVDWSFTEGFSTGLSCVSWDGNEWFVGSMNENVLVSKDALQWRFTTGDTSGTLTIATPIVLPIIGGDLNVVNSIIVGSGNPTSVIRSYDDVNWINQILTDDKKFFTNEIRKSFYGAVWSGTKWVIVGNRDLTGKSICVSTNGIDWKYPTNTLENGRDIAYGGGLYVAVGKSTSPTGKIVTSTDAETWTSQSCPITNLSCVGYNGTKWVVGGLGGIAYSTNGTTWTKSVTCPLTTVNDIAWNGYYWVATGKGTAHNFALSIDSIHWYIANSIMIPFLEGNSIAWNRTQWVAVGRDTNNAIATSIDGYTWAYVTQSIILNGNYVTWTGSKWLVAGGGSSPVITSTDAITWTDYPLTLTQGNGFASKSVSLPITGISSSYNLTRITTVVDELTQSTNATLAEEAAAAALAANQAAQAAALAKRNATKAEADTYNARLIYWKTTMNTQFEPLKNKTYVDIASIYPSEYSAASGIVTIAYETFAAGASLYDTIYDDSNSQTAIEEALENLKATVKICEENIVRYYNSIRVLYKHFTNRTCLALTPSTMYDLLYNYGFSTQVRDLVRGFYVKKATALLAKSTSIQETCNIPVTTVTYSNGTSNATDYKALYNTIFEYDIQNLPSTYKTDNSNAFYFLTLMNSIYLRMDPYKRQCDDLVSKSVNEATKWAQLAGQSLPSSSTIRAAFANVYAKYFRDINQTFLVPSYAIDNGELAFTDISVRAFKNIADTFCHPISYPSELLILHDQTLTTLLTVDSTRQTAINYMRTKRNTTIKNKLNDILSVTKLPYSGPPLQLDAHIEKICNTVFHKDSNYASCSSLVNLLKVGNVLYPTMKNKILAVPAADIEAEEDGVPRPEHGWGTSYRVYPLVNVDLVTVTNSKIINQTHEILIDEKIIIKGTSIPGGVTPTNDILITVSDVDNRGTITNYTITGTLPSSKTFTAISGSRAENSSISLQVVPSGSGYVTSLRNFVGSGGSGYSVGQQLHIAGTQLFRKSPENDISITITQVDNTGSVTQFTTTGNSQLSTFDDVPSYRNTSASFTFLSSVDKSPSQIDNFVVTLRQGGVKYAVSDVIPIKGTEFGGASPENDVSIIVDEVTVFGSITKFHTVGTPASYKQYGPYGLWLGPKDNETATFTVSNITNSSTFTCAIKNKGSGYVVGDKVLVSGKYFPGGSSPFNDIVLSVLTTNASGGIETFSVISGNFGFFFQSINVNTTILEQNATFDITRPYTSNPTYTVQINTPGNGYQIGETITILGDKLGGKTPDNNVVITVTGIGSVGAISTFTHTGTPITVLRIDTTPPDALIKLISKKQGKSGLEKLINCTNKRTELSNFLYSNSARYGDAGTKRYITNIPIRNNELVFLNDFMDFTNTTTYDSMVEKKTLLENKVALLNSNSELSETYVNTLVSNDLTTIQSKYVENAVKYTTDLLNSVHEILASAKFSINATTLGVFNNSMINGGYGYEVNDELVFPGTLFNGGTSPANDLIFKVLTVGESGQILTYQKKSGTAPREHITNKTVTNNKLVSRFSALASAEAAIESNYLILQNAPGSIPGKSNSEIATIVTNAKNAKEAIDSIQNGDYPSKIKGAIEYLRLYKIDKNKVLTTQDDLRRWLQMKANATKNAPFLTETLSNGVGDPFIMSIPPTNTNYWIERVYPTYKLTPDGSEIFECTLDQGTGKVVTSVSTPFDLTKINQYSATSEYRYGSYTKFNNQVYVCIKDADIDITVPTSTDGIKNIPPTNTVFWNMRRYPDVTIGNVDREYTETLSKPLDINDYRDYLSIKEYSLGSIVRSNGSIYLCKNVVNSDEPIKGISPSNVSYWKEVTYPTVTTLDGTILEGNPSLFPAYNAYDYNEVTNPDFSFKKGDVAKTVLSFVDDNEYYHEGSATFFYYENSESLTCQGYPPVYVYDSTHHYQNFLMWQFVGSGAYPGVEKYSSSTVYKKGDYAYYVGVFYDSTGTLVETTTNTFKLIAPYFAKNPLYSNSVASALYPVRSNFPVAKKSIGYPPTTTPWRKLQASSDTYPTYSNTVTYTTGNVVTYTNPQDGQTNNYIFDGTLKTYNSNSIVYILFGKQSANKTGWLMRSRPSVYYNNILTDSSTIPQLNPADFSAYDSTVEYSVGSMVSYSQKVYRCILTKPDIIIDVPVENTNYWKKIRYNLITYDDNVIEAVPGAIPLLDPDDFDEYSPTETYFEGDVVKLTNNQTQFNLNTPLDVVANATGTIYITDKNNNLIKEVLFQNNIPTVVNIGREYGPLSRSIDGTTTTASYSNNLRAIALDDATNTIYFSDSNLIRKITSDGQVISYTTGLGYQDGAAASAKFSTQISGLIFDPDLKCLYVSDTLNHRIRKISEDGTVTTLAGSVAGFQDGTGSNAKFNLPGGIDIDLNGNLYVADTGNHCIRKVTPLGVVTRLAGSNAFPGYLDSSGMYARFNSPYGIAVDNQGYIYVADTGNHCIRKVTSAGVVTTFAGTNEAGNVDDDGEFARFKSPCGMSFDKFNNLFVADTGNNKIRRIRPDSRVLSAVKDQAFIYECINSSLQNPAIKNIPTTNTEYWKPLTYPEVYIDDIPYEADPNNITVFKALDQYDYPRYDNNWMYKFGDRVAYNGKIYDCINAEPVETPDTHLVNVPPPNDICWQRTETYESLTSNISTWFNGRSYTVGDTTMYLNQMYRCIESHKATTNDIPSRAPRWVPYTTPQKSSIPAWSPIKPYASGDVVLYGSKLYKSITTHSSTNNGKPDVTPDIWEEYDPAKIKVKNWELNMLYKVGSFCRYNSQGLYICVLQHTSTSVDSPTYTNKWVAANPLTASSIIVWDANIEYSVGTIVMYDGYFYRCEVLHYSTFTDSPADSRYYWSKVQLLSNIGLPDFYDSTTLYSIGDIVTIRVGNKDPQHSEDLHTVEFYKCMQTSLDAPAEFTYDELALLPSKDGDGNYKTAVIPGTWNKNNLPRYGPATKDPFRIQGFAGKLRRKVWMDIEMPYRRLLYLDTYQDYIDNPTPYYGGTSYIASLFKSARPYSVTTHTNPTYGYEYETYQEVLRPNDFEVDQNYILDTLLSVMADFKASKTGVDEETKTIETMILDAYGFVIQELDDAKTLPYEPKTEFINGNGDDAKCIDQLVFEIQTMKMQYFNNPGVQAEIQENPYKFMSAIALAQNPPKKLFKDLGVGDIDELNEYLRLHPDGGKYSPETIDFMKSQIELLNSKLEMVSLRCFEQKLKLGFLIGTTMLASDSKMGGRFICDSGTFDLPIGDWNTIACFKNPPVNGILSRAYDIINTSVAPPEYTLPTSQAARDLFILTYEVQNPVVNGLAAVAKGTVGLTVGLFEGSTNVVGQMVNGIASMHAAVLEARGKLVDDATSRAVSLTSTNFVKFNQNDESIQILKQQVNYYRNSVVESEVEISEDIAIDSLTRIGVMLTYLANYERQIKLAVKERFQTLPPTVEVPSKPERVIICPPERPQTKAMKELSDLRDMRAELVRQRIRYMNVLDGLSGRPPIPRFAADIPELVTQTIQRTLSVDPPPNPYPDKLRQTKIRLAVQNTVIFERETRLKTLNAELRSMITENSRFNRLAGTITEFTNGKLAGFMFDASRNFPFTFNGQTYTLETFLQLNSDDKIALRNSLTNSGETSAERITAKRADIANIVDEIGKAKQTRVGIRFRLNALQSLSTKYLERWRAANPLQSIQDYSVRELSGDELWDELERQLKEHEVKVNEIKAERHLIDVQESYFKEKLNLTEQQLKKVTSDLSEANIENMMTQVENDRTIARYRAELELAEAEQEVQDKKYEYLKQKREELRRQAGIANQQRVNYLKELQNNTNIMLEDIELIRNEKRQVVALRALDLEESIFGKFEITGSFAAKALQNAVIIPFEILATALALLTGVGEVPYRVEELISGRYLYNKLPPTARLRIDNLTIKLNKLSSDLSKIPVGARDATEIALSKTLDTISDAWKNITKSTSSVFVDIHHNVTNVSGAIVDDVKRQLEKIVSPVFEYIERRRSIRKLVRNPKYKMSFLYDGRGVGINNLRKSRLIVGDRRKFGSVFQGRRTGARLGAALNKIGLRTSKNVSTVLNTVAGALGTTPTKRFMGGLGVAMEVAGAAIAAWQGGAFTQGETLGF